MIKTKISLETFENIIIALLREKGYDTEVVILNGTGGPEHHLGEKRNENEKSRRRIFISINVEKVYDWYINNLNNGKPPLLDDVVNKIISDFETEVPECITEASANIHSWDWVKNRLILALYNTEMHAEYLKGKVYEKIDDLAITPGIYIKSSNGTASTLVDYHMLKDWSVTKEEVMQQAKISAAQLLPLYVADIESLLFGFKDRNVIDVSKQKVSDIIKEPSLYAITTNVNSSGASLFYEGVLDELAKIFGGFFFIIPSSLREVLVMPGDKAMSPEELSAMITDINNMKVVVEPVEVLANHGYVYYHGKVSAYV